MLDIVSDDEGPFSPERSGRLPIKNFIKLCARSVIINDIKKMVEENRTGFASRDKQRARGTEEDRFR